MQGRRGGRSAGAMPREAGPELAESGFGGDCEMADPIFVLVTVGFFALAWAYVRGCDKL